jgi:hypothetical protein
MVLNSYILNKENIPQDTRPMTWLDYAIQIIEALADELLQEKNYAGGLSDTGGTSDIGDDSE